jgi:hypothetical protein
MRSQTSCTCAVALGVLPGDWQASRMRAKLLSSAPTAPNNSSTPMPGNSGFLGQLLPLSAAPPE